MKIWIKYLTGILIGIAFAIVAPDKNAAFSAVTEFLAQFFIQAGRYALYPVLFFSITLSVYEHRENRTLLRMGWVTALIIVASTVAIALLALISVLIANPARIPIFVEGSSDIETIGIAETFLQLLPSSAFEVFTNGAFILPLCVFGAFAGAGCAVDKNDSKTALNLFDSLSRVSYAIMTFFVDSIAIGMIALAVNWTLEFRVMFASKVFTDFILLLILDFAILAGILWPLAIRLTCGKVNPYRVLYASTASVLGAFFSGDTVMTLPILFRHANESLGIRRRISTISLPMFSIFARGGTVLVVITGFLLILKSYSSLGVSFLDTVWLVGAAIGLSFFLGRFPSGGAFVALATVCALYGRGFESGYLILKPAAFFLGSIAAAIDALTAIMGTYIIAQRQEQATHRELRFFI